MANDTLTSDQAFTILRRRSQNTNVKPRVIAVQVIATGSLPTTSEPSPIR